MKVYGSGSRFDTIMNPLDENDKIPNAHNFCKSYIRGSCFRENCRYIHELPPRTCLKELFRFCHDFQNKGCYRINCKFIHSSAEDEENFYSTGKFPRDARGIRVCQAYIHGACTNQECEFIHPPDVIANQPVPMMNMPPPLLQFSRPPPRIRDDDAPPEAKLRRYAYEESLDQSVLSNISCPSCESLDHKVTLLHDNISVLLKKVADLTEKNVQLTSMNEFLLGQTASIRSDQPCVITSRHCTSAPVSLATVSVTPVVSLAGALPALVPAGGGPNLALAPSASRAQLLTPAPQILTVSTTQQLMGNSGALIVTSAGAQQLMQVSDSGTLMGGGQTVVAVTPAQLTLTPQAQQLMSNASQTTVQQLVQQSALQPQLAQQHQSQYAAQQSVQHLAAQQSAQHLAQQSAQHLAQQSAQHLAQQSAQHLAHQSAQHLAAQQSQHLAQQSAQHLAAQQSAQHMAAQQSAQHLSAQQHLVAAQQSAQQLAAAAQQSAQQMAQQSAQQLAAQQTAQQLAAQQSAQQQLVHQTSTQQITISSSSQPMALPNSQAQPMTFPIISQSILPH